MGFTIGEENIGWRIELQIPPIPAAFPFKEKAGIRRARRQTIDYVEK
jgi:hypothetical protein